MDAPRVPLTLRDFIGRPRDGSSRTSENWLALLVDGGGARCTFKVGRNLQTLTKIDNVHVLRYALHFFSEGDVRIFFALKHLLQIDEVKLATVTMLLTSLVMVVLGSSWIFHLADKSASSAAA